MNTRAIEAIKAACLFRISDLYARKICPLEAYAVRAFVDPNRTNRKLQRRQGGSLDELALELDCSVVELHAYMNGWDGLKADFGFIHAYNAGARLRDEYRK